MTTQEAKALIIKNIKKLPYKEEVKGGQSYGIIYCGIRLYSEELDCEVMINLSRSQLKNYDTAMTIMQMLIDDYVK
jgi:protein subunit release factor A